MNKNVIQSNECLSCAKNELFNLEIKTNTN